MYIHIQAFSLQPSHPEATLGSSEPTDEDPEVKWEVLLLHRFQNTL